MVWYVGLITLRHKGKIFGETMRQYSAKSVSDFRKIAKKRMKFKGVTVTVSKIKKRTRR